MSQEKSVSVILHVSMEMAVTSCVLDMVSVMSILTAHVTTK